jgi:hypothetical protein
MKRRTFLKNSIGMAALAAGTLPLAAGAAFGGKTRQEYYELRAYRLGAGKAADRVHEYLSAGIPILNKLGCKPIGVFTEMEPKGPESVFVLLTYPTLEVYGRAVQWLKTNDELWRTAKNYADASKDNPAFERIDSWLMLAFAGMPKMELPAFSKEKKPRMFELRTYESHSEAKAARKVEMFNDGEIDVMREVGLNPVFYGEALIGPNLPHLTYMISAEDEKSHKAHWEAFGKHATWDRMKNDPKYADTVSKITKWLLKPADYSQI